MRTGRLGRTLATAELWLPLGAHELMVLSLLLSGVLAFTAFLH